MSSSWVRNNNGVTYLQCEYIFIPQMQFLMNSKGLLVCFLDLKRSIAKKIWIEWIEIFEKLYNIVKSVGQNVSDSFIFINSHSS